MVADWWDLVKVAAALAGAAVQAYGALRRREAKVETTAPGPVAPEELMTPEEVGAWLRLAPRTVMGWAQKGKIPGHKIARKTLRFRRSEVAAALNLPE